MDGSAFIESTVDYVSIAKEYARRVVRRERLSCEYEFLACKRFLANIRKSKSKKYPWKLSDTYANDACDFISKCKHVEGDLAGQEIGELLDYWAFIVVNIFGWRRKRTGERLVHLVYIEITRKAAKSTMLAAIALYLQNCDGVGSPTIVIGASKETQANKVFNPARMMVETDEELCNEFGLTTTKNEIKSTEPDGGVGTICKVQSKGDTEDGWNVLAAILDELHAHKDSSLYNVLRSGMGAIQNWLLLMITTAGRLADGVCWDRRRELIQVLRGERSMEHFFGVIYTLDDGDDPYDPEVFEKSNPQMGAIISRETIEMASIEAQEDAEVQAEFLRTRHNLWARGALAYYPMEAYDNCFREHDIPRGSEIYVASDLATEIDIAGYAMMSEHGSEIAFKHRYFIPERFEDNVDPSMLAQYEQWIDHGWIETTPGKYIDQSYVEKRLLEDVEPYKVLGMAFDPWNSAAFMNSMEKKGFEVIKYPQNTRNFSAPTKNLKERIKTRRLIHDGNPVTRWMFANVTCHLDANSNVFPKKSHPTSPMKIDGAIMSTMCNGLRINDIEPDDTGPKPHPLAAGIRSLMPDDE